MTNGNDSVHIVLDGVSGPDHFGLTKREYFAATADVNLYADYSIALKEKVVGRVMPTYTEDVIGYIKFNEDFLAIIKCIKADALITELNK